MSNNSRTSKTYQWKWSNDINTLSRSILPTTRKIDEAGQTRRTLPIFQTFFNIQNEEGSTFGKHELDCRPFDPPCRPHPSDREFFIFLPKTSWKESNRVDRGEEDTLPYGKMFHGDRCKSASIPSPPLPSGEDTSDTYEKGGWTTLFPRTTGFITYEAVRVSRMAFDFESGSLGHRKRRDAIMF